MFHSANLCDKCDAPTANPENDYGEFVCDTCEDNAAERAWERHCTDYDSGLLPLIEQQRQALKFK
jgi:hypothetical protein